MSLSALNQHASQAELDVKVTYTCSRTESLSTLDQHTFQDGLDVKVTYMYSRSELLSAKPVASQ